MEIIKIMKKDNTYYSDHKLMPGALQVKAKTLCWDYNQTSPREEEKRRNILKELLGSYNPLVFIQPSFSCDYGFNIHIEGLAVINYNCVILDTSPVRIGKNAFLGPGVCLACSGHSLDPEQRAEGIGTSSPITLGDDVWIGASSVICGGVTIGSATVIGAGSVVTKDIPAGVLAAGNPCQVIRKISQQDKIDKNLILR